MIREAEDWGHGDTLDGQLMRRTHKRVSADMEELKDLALAGMRGVSDRARGELRRRILLLPAPGRVARMSMHELEGLGTQVEAIRNDVRWNMADPEGGEACR